MNRYFTSTVIALIAMITFTACEQKEEVNEVNQNVDIGVYNGEASLLAIIAHENEIFKKHNLNVNLKPYKTGKDAFSAMLNGEVSYSTATEFVAVKNSFTNTNFKILASISQANINGMLGKKSSNINTGYDLKNKRIGTTIGTATEFYTGVFLEQFNISLGDVKLVNVSPKDRLSSYGENNYDALFAWEPHIYKIRKQYPDNFEYFNMPLSFNFDFILAVDNMYNEQNQNVSKKVLNALIEAQSLLESGEINLNEFLKNYFKYDDDYIKYSENKYKFKVNLNYPMLVNMNKQVSYLVENNLVEGNINAKDLIYTKTLNEIDTKRVGFWE